jgi:Phage tail sheath C-terminal domain
LQLDVRLPGISIEPLAAPPRAGLPPMDVALFAGFAQRGPCNRAVAVDSIAGFEACFGGDLPLARDNDSGKMLYANLPGSVRAFFANGGRRCWVVRLARTRTHEKRWSLYTGRDMAKPHCAQANRFAVNGMLGRLTNGDENESLVQPAWLTASSMGSWSDNLQLSVRLNQFPFVATDLKKIEFGLHFANPGGLSPGDLIEFISTNVKVRRYAKIVRQDADRTYAIWCASLASATFCGPMRLGAIAPVLHEDQTIFDHRQIARRPVKFTLPQPVAGLKSGQWLEYQKENDAVWVLVSDVQGPQITGSAWRVQPGEAMEVGGLQHHPATLVEGRSTQIICKALGGASLGGKWVQFRSQGEAVWMQVERAVGAALYGQGWQQIASRLPRGRFSARRVTIDIRSEENGRVQTLADINPAQTGDRSVLSLTTDDEDYSADQARRARHRFPLSIEPIDRQSVDAAVARTGQQGFEALAALFGTDQFTSACRDALRHSWLPVGVGPDFAEASTALPQSRPALARDGLSLFDESLFLDPAFADASVGQIISRIEQIRDIDEQQLTGIYAGLDAPDEEFGIASIIAVPDLAQPGWQLSEPTGIPGTPNPGAPDQARWYDHALGCSAKHPDEPKQRLAAPDNSRFLDCSTQVLATPTLSGPTESVADGSFALQWTAAEAGTIFVIEESGSADFAGAVEIYRGTGSQLDLNHKGEGVYYYRLHAELGGNVSAYSAIVVTVGQSDYETTEPDGAILKRLHLAVIRLAAGTADSFALLSLPENYRAKAAIEHSTALRQIANGFGGRDALGRGEERALSYAALYHPWCVYRVSREQALAHDMLASSAPDGWVAGQMAAVARQQGAWIAPANDAFVDVSGLSPLLADAEQPELYRAKINMVRNDPRGFLLMDADTLSADPEWQQINVRRLMILLRRMAIMRGQTYVFESNDDMMRRAVERDLTFALDGMQRRGAFAGRTSAQSFRIAADRRADDYQNGRLAFEIGVAPSQPMRFLNIRLVQHGARLTVAEEAA